MKAFFTILITLLSLPFYAVSPRSEGVHPARTTVEVVFQGGSISYDAAGNRVFRSRMPQIELPGTEAPQPVDTMITPGPDPRTGEAGPDPGSGEVEPVEEP